MLGRQRTAKAKRPQTAGRQSAARGRIAPSRLPTPRALPRRVIMQRPHLGPTLLRAAARATSPRAATFVLIADQPISKVLARIRGGARETEGESLARAGAGRQRSGQGEMYRPGPGQRLAEQRDRGSKSGPGPSHGATAQPRPSPPCSVSRAGSSAAAGPEGAGRGGGKWTHAGRHPRAAQSDLIPNSGN